jgi:hypothetical protein
MPSGRFIQNPATIIPRRDIEINLRLRRTEIEFQQFMFAIFAR